MRYGFQQWDIYFTGSSDGGATFQGPVNVSNTSGISLSPATAVDASSTAYIAWMYSPPSPYNFNVYFSRSAALSSLSLDPSSVTGGSSSTATVTLRGPAPTGGAVMSLSSSNPAVASVPDSVTIAEGSTSVTFSVAISSVAAPTTVTISAAYNGATQTASLTVDPPTLTSLSLSPSSVTGGSSSNRLALNWQSIWPLYGEELLLVKIDGMAVYRLAHHRSRSAEYYWAQPHAVISRDGRYVVWDSNFDISSIGDANYADVYLTRVQ